MALATLQYRSAILGREIGAQVFVPANCAGPYCVLYLLHGLTNDFTGWNRWTRIEHHLEALNLPLLVVMPEGGRGFWTDAAQGFAFESSVTNELVPFIDSTFQTRAAREARAIGGMSMGGFGALRMALRNPQLFVSANSHAGGVMWARAPEKQHYNQRQKQADEWSRILGDAASESDLWSLSEQAMKRAQRTALRLDCGTEDFLIEENRELHAHLNAVGYCHEYAEAPGAHNGEYWDAQIPAALAFHVRHLFP